MFIIPGWLISGITFPGVIVHEIAHRIFCHLTGVPVYQVAYYRFGGNPAGYVIHGEPPTLKSALLISIGPLIVNSLLCMLLTFAAIIPLMVLQDGAVSGVSIFLFWIGISIGMHAFPSNHDVQSFVDMVEERRGQGALWVVCWLAGGVLKIANVLRFVWLDFFYAIGLAVVLPLSLGLI